MKGEQVPLSINGGSALLIQRGEGDWSVWISLPDHHPIRDPFGFIIGSGATRDEAVADAVKGLELLVDRLQGPPGTIREERKD